MARCLIRLDVGGRFYWRINVYRGARMKPNTIDFGLVQHLKKAAKERFFNSFIPEPNSGCWLWLGGSSSDGRGSIKVNKKQWKAHRYSWFLHYGAIPDRLFVCHHCDTPCCVNPKHLFLGTHQDNMNDQKAKGRSSFGANNPNAIITDDIAQKIKADTRYQREIAKTFGISRSLVSNIKCGISWRHVK